MHAHTDLSFLDEGRRYPPDPVRMAEYCENIAIRENRFDDAWIDFNRLMREDNSDRIKTWLGYFWRSTQRSMDFLLGKEMDIGSSEDDTPEDELIEDFVEQSDIYQTVFEAMVDCDSLGDGILKIYKDADGRAIVQSNSPTVWTQVVEKGNLRKPVYHVLITKFEVETSKPQANNTVYLQEEQDQCYIKVEIHSKNAVEHRVYELNESPMNRKVALIGKRMPFAMFADQFPDLQEIEVHNLGEFLVIPIPNTRTSCDIYGKSSYNLSAKSIAKKLIDRYNQIDRVLDKHSDPNMIGPKGMMELNPITHKPMMRGGGRYFGYRHDPDMAPPKVEYLTWDGNLVPSETAIARLINDLFNELELPPVSMAKDTTGVVSGTAYRLMLTPLLAKVARLERTMVPNVTKAIKLAMRYQGTPVEDVCVEIEDAMPTIPLEESQRIAQLATSGIFAGSVGTQYLLEQAGVPSEIAAKIAGTAMAEAPSIEEPMMPVVEPAVEEVEDIEELS